MTDEDCSQIQRICLCLYLFIKHQYITLYTLASHNLHIVKHFVEHFSYKPYDFHIMRRLCSLNKSTNYGRSLFISFNVKRGFRDGCHPSFKGMIWYRQWFTFVCRHQHYAQFRMIPIDVIHDIFTPSSVWPEFTMLIEEWNRYNTRLLSQIRLGSKPRRIINEILISINTW